MANKTNAYLQLGGREGMRQRFRHQVSYPEHLKYNPVMFSNTEMVRGKDIGQCSWCREPRVKVSPLLHWKAGWSPRGGQVAEDKAVHSHLWASLTPWKCSFIFGICIYCIQAFLLYLCLKFFSGYLKNFEDILVSILYNCT